MSKKSIFVTVGLFVLSAFCTAFSAEEYVLMLEGQPVQLTPRPDIGYVIRAPKEALLNPEDRGQRKGVRRPKSLNGELARLDIPPLGSSNNRGVYVVQNASPLTEKGATARRLADQAKATHVAPLFSCNGVTVAIFPEIVVHIKSGTDIQELATLSKMMDLAIVGSLEFTTQEFLLEVQGQSAEDVFDAVEALNSIDGIEWAAPNKASQVKTCGHIFPNDGYFPKQWHLHNTGQSGGTPDADINAPEAWEITTGDPNIVVAVIDDGVDMDHPDLIDNLVPGYDFRDDDDWPDQDTSDPNNRHGTACAGLVAARGNNAIGIAGVAYNCKIMPIRIEFGEPNNPTRETMFATAIRWAAVHGADILSNSWGHQEVPWPIVHSAIRDVTKPGGLGRDGKGSVCFFAAGNESSDEPSWPSDYPETVSVGATDHNDQPTWYTNFGPQIDIVAPGGGSTKGEKHDLIWTTDIVGVAGYSDPNEDPNFLDYNQAFAGTSASTPIAAGVAALILSVEPNLTVQQVRDFLAYAARDLGEPGWDETFGHGRVDARASLDMVLAKRADLNDDWRVDNEDLHLLLEWIDANDPRADIGPIPRPDGVIDERDQAFLEQYLDAEIPEPGLIAHWALDETEGQIAHESVGGKHGELFGDPIWQPADGMIDGALRFDGLNDLVGTEYILDPAAGAFSVFLWVKGGVAGQGVVSQLWGLNWLMADETQGYLKTELRKASHTAQPLVSDVTITDGSWHHIGLTWDGKNRILYVDGIEIAADNQTELARNIEGLNIGCGPDMTPGSFWSGLIDDVRIYNRAVSP